MEASPQSTRKWLGASVVAASALLALLSAFPYAGSANDGSRLATAECLVDHGTFAIDDSVFVRVPPTAAGSPGPYKPGLGESHGGTIDRMYIRGHFYSDKPPVLSLVMAGLYSALQALTGLSAGVRPDLFCRAMTFGTAGIAYVIAVACVWQMFGRSGVAPPRRLAMAALFALGTVALPYMRNVNNHVVLLGAAAGVFLWLDVLAECGRNWRPGAVLALGAFAGSCYTLDVAAGAPLIAAGLVVAYRTRSAGAVSLFALAALPWLAVHHAVTYAIAGTIGPPGTVPEYFRWPGSPFDASNLTGVLPQRGTGSLLLYTAELLVSRKQGFLTNNLPLLLVFPALRALWRQRRRVREWPEVLLALGWSAATVVVYAGLSTNHAGTCTSVRWFVPLLAAGFYVVAVAARYEPALLDRLGVLVGWSLACGVLLWFEGAWGDRSVPMLWLVEVLGIVHWLGDRLAGGRRGVSRPVLRAAG
jgi:hypothetical protein